MEQLESTDKQFFDRVKNILKEHEKINGNKSSQDSPETNGKVQVELEVDENTVLVTWVLRDSMQSLVSQVENWLTDADVLGDLLIQAQKSGFFVVEWGGGRAREVAALNRLNINRLHAEARDKLLANTPKGETPIARMSLYRGPQVTGYRPKHPSVQKAIIERDAETGTTFGRHFDGLNDIKNLTFYDENDFDTKVESFHSQFAMAFATGPRYTDEYYVALALEGKAKGAKSLCVKDTAGLIREDRIRTLIPKLKKATGLDVTLHTHSTAHEASKNAIRAAVECGIKQIEVSIAPLSKKTAHHDIGELLDDPIIGPKISLNINRQELQKLEVEMFAIFKDVETVGESLSNEILAILSDAGVAGGAAPAVLSLIKENFASFFEKGSESALINLVQIYASELKIVRKDANFPPPITPFEDICTRQATFNIAYSRAELGLTPENLNGETHLPSTENLSLENRYKTVTKAFLDMNRGYYGFLRDYSEKDENGVFKIDGPEKSFREFILKQPIAYGVGEGEKQSEYEDYYETENHLSTRLNELPTLDDFLEKADDFEKRVAENIETYGIRKERAEFLAHAIMEGYGPKIDRAIAYVENPKGKPESFAETEVILGYLKSNNEVVFRKHGIRQLINKLVLKNQNFEDLIDSEKFPIDMIVLILNDTLELVNKQLEKYKGTPLPYRARIKIEPTGNNEKDQSLLEYLRKERLEELRKKLQNLSSKANREDEVSSPKNWIKTTEPPKINKQSQPSIEIKRLKEAIDCLELQGTKEVAESFLEVVSKNGDSTPEDIAALKAWGVEIMKANLYRIATEKNLILSTRPQWIIDREVDLGEIEYEGQRYEYTVVEDDIKEIGEDNGYLFISQVIPKNSREAMLKREIKKLIQKREISPMGKNES